MVDTRITLIEKLKDIENFESWREFHDLYAGIIIGWACRMGCPQTLAADVLQEVMVTLFRSMPSFEYTPDKGSFRSYLKVIVQRRTIDAFRREGRYLTVNEDESNLFDKIEMEEATPGEPLEMDGIWLREILAQALKVSYGKIDQQTYKAFCMYVLDELPAEEVIKRLNIKRLGTLYQQKSRFLIILKNSFFTLLCELSNGEFNVANTDSMDKLFNSALNELIQGKRELRNTLVKSDESIAAIKNAQTTMNLIKKNVPPEKDASYLFLLKKNEPGTWIKLQNKLTIGSSDKCDVVLDYEGVSGLHCTVEKTEKGFILNDENSTNGTFVNKRKITGPMILKDGDTVQIALCHLVFITP